MRTKRGFSSSRSEGDFFSRIEIQFSATRMTKGAEDSDKGEKDKKKWLNLSPIAKPLVSKKLNKKALKLVKKGNL